MSRAAGDRDQRGRTADRGQTTLDFAIGAGIFLTATVVAVAFIPSVVTPFDNGVEENVVTADRVATDLATRTLGRAAEPYELDAHCTAAFFDPGLDAGPCSFSNGPPDYVAESTGVADRQVESLRIEVRGDLTDADEIDQVLCWDADASAPGSTRPRFYETDDVGATTCSSSEVLAYGDPAPNVQSVATSRRSVSIDGTYAQLNVSVW